MKRARLFAFAVLAAGCASSAAVKPPVKVVVTADQQVGRFIDSDKIAEMTEAAVRKYAAGAGPATISVHFDKLAVVRPDQSAEMISQQHHAVAVASARPFDEPGTPTVAVAPPGLAGSGVVSGVAQLVVGTYTISDAAGNLLEQKPISIHFDYLDDQYWTSVYLAKRLAQLTRKSG